MPIGSVNDVSNSFILRSVSISKSDRFHQSDLGDAVCVHAFGEIGQVENGLVDICFGF